MTSREIAGDDTGVSAHGLFHPEPSWPAQLALNRPSTYSTCWRPRLGVQGHRGGLGGRGGLSAPLRFRSVHPLGGKTTDRRAGCGRSACPVRREGGPGPLGPSSPYTQSQEFSHRLLKPSPGVWTSAGAARLGLRRPAPQPALHGTRRLDAALWFYAATSMRSHSPSFGLTLWSRLFPHGAPSNGHRKAPGATPSRRRQAARTPRIPVTSNRIRTPVSLGSECDRRSVGSSDRDQIRITAHLGRQQHRLYRQTICWF